MTVTLYSYFRSSCSWRVRAAFNILKVPHVIKTINLLKNEQQSSAFKSINPLGTVPAAQVSSSGAVITQSLAIIDFFDRDQRLLPNEPVERARCMQIALTIASDIQPVQNISVLNRVKELAGEEARSQWAVDRNRSQLKIINDNLVEKEAHFCVGKTVTIADVCLVPQLYSAARFGINIQEEFPNLYSIAKNLEQLEEFRMAHPHAQSDCPEDIKKLGIFFT